MSDPLTKKSVRKSLPGIEKVKKLNRVEIEKMKSSFLSNVSHEIRTPLNAIVGFSNLLTDPLLKSEDREGFVRIINENCQSLLDAMDKIFDMVVLEKDHLAVNEREFSLPSLMDGLIYHYSGIISSGNRNKVDLRLCLDHAYYPGRIVSDPDLLKKILGHLIENSIKFTKSGFIEVGCTAREPGTLQFYVKDSGIGIPEEKIQDIFDKFSQVEEYYTRNYGGLGIGLTIAYGLVRKMGGEMFVESAIDKGSTFYFIIPYKEAEFSYDEGEAENQANAPDKGQAMLQQARQAEDQDLNSLNTYSFLPLTQRFSA